MRVLVTGASRGIGKAIADAFASRGYEVIAPPRSELDLSNKKSVEDYVEKHRLDPLDALVNNAGINEISFIEDADDATLDRMLEVDLISPIRLVRGMVPQLRKSSCGRIVNIGSIWAVASKPGRGMYAAAKHGLHGVTGALAVELASSGVLVNTLCPGFTATELTVQNNSADEIRSIESAIPLGRLAQPEEIAKAVYFLGSGENTYITGQKIVIDGGFTVQ